MFLGYQTEAELFQNMMDAGCGKDIANGVLFYLRQGQRQRGLSLLQEQRGTLLEEIHRGKSCIGFLDSLLCGMRKEDIL